MASSISTARRIEYAQGYLELGMLVEASDELEAIDGEDRLSIPVMEVRMHLHIAAQQWDIAAACAGRVVDAKPDDEQGWISWAYAARRLVGIPTAEAILLRAEKLLGEKCALIHFNLACYRCQLGDISGARERLRIACKMEPAMKAMALDDPDLEPMWTAITDTK